MFVAVRPTVLHLLPFSLRYCTTCTYIIELHTLDREASIRVAHMYVMLFCAVLVGKHIEVQRCLHVVLTRRNKAQILGKSEGPFQGSRPFATTRD